jgi:hypothetical protein
VVEEWIAERHRPGGTLIDALAAEDGQTNRGAGLNAGAAVSFILAVGFRLSAVS